MRDELGRAYATGRRKTASARVWVKAVSVNTLCRCIPRTIMRQGCAMHPPLTFARRHSLAPSDFPPPQGDGAFTINGKTLAAYFARTSQRVWAIEPLMATQAVGAFDVWLTVSGGGLTGQAGAIRHGLANALARYDPYLKAPLKKREWATARGEAEGLGCCNYDRAQLSLTHSSSSLPLPATSLPSDSTPSQQWACCCATRVKWSARSRARRARAASSSGCGGRRRARRGGRAVWCWRLRVSRWC
jgi:ribosomal protein S9